MTKGPNAMRPVSTLCLMVALAIFLLDDPPAVTVASRRRRVEISAVVVAAWLFVRCGRRGGCKRGEARCAEKRKQCSGEFHA